MQNLFHAVSEFVSRMKAFVAPAGVEQAQPIVIMSPRMMMIIRKRQIEAARRDRY